MRHSKTTLPERKAVPSKMDSAPVMSEEWLRLLLNETPTPVMVLDRDQRLIANSQGAARLFGARIRSRCNSTEEFRAFLLDPSMPLCTARLVGCTEAEGRAAAATINGLGSRCRITATMSGFLDESAYREGFQGAEDDFILLGLSTPRTQYVAEVAAEACPQAIVWGVGAGTIRILAGTMREAPGFWRRSGLQWLYRLLVEPKHLWRRYLLGNPLFVLRILKAWLYSRFRFNSGGAERRRRGG